MKLSLAILALAAAVSSQVPLGYVVIAERTGGTKPGILLLDPATGVVTPIEADVAADTMKELLTVAVDPADPGTLYANGSTTTFLGGDVWPIALTGNKHPKIGNWRPTGMPGFAFPYRFEVAGKFLLMTIQGGSNNGLFEIDVANRSVRKLPVTLPNFAGDIKMIGAKAYVSTDGAASTIAEWDTATSQSRILGSAYPTLKSLAVRAGKLLAGTATGDILDVDLTTGSTTVWLATGKGPIDNMVVYPPTGALYFSTTTATAKEVYVHADLSKPLYSTANVIRDLEIGIHALPSLLRFGTGCLSSVPSTPAFEHVNVPKLGGNFTLKLVGGRPASPALLWLGSSRKQFGALVLPVDLGGLGMPGCWLYTDILIPLATATDVAGTASSSFGLPNDLALNGLHLIGQWLVRDASVNNAGLITSNGAEAILRS